jgi:hypothetical protein
VIPFVGQLISVIVRTQFAPLKAESTPATEGEANKGEFEQPVSVTILQEMLDELLTPLSEKVNRLECELHTVAGGSE